MKGEEVYFVKGERVEGGLVLRNTQIKVDQQY